ncbi:MAG: prenyltransferase/squalene oxidase repeat-containing protein [Planctomycetota bacterium]
MLTPRISLAIAVVVLCCLVVSCRTTDSREENALSARPAFSDDPALGPIDAAIAKGLDYFAANASRKDGSFGLMMPDKEGKEQYIPDVGITGLIVEAVVKSPFAGYEKQQPYLKQAVGYLLANVRKDGSIAEADQGYSNYKTSIVLMALHSIDEPEKYSGIIKGAQDYIRSQQFAENQKVEEEDWRYGGIGYGSKIGRPDLSNTQWAVEALRETGVSEKDPLFKKVTVYVSRCQNKTDSNDYDRRQTDIVSINDGGARYKPTESKIEVEVSGKRMLLSYGSMTYAFLKSMIYAGVSRDDPRVQAAFQWILNNYSLDKNPGFSTKINKDADKQGLYYYYHTMSKALLVMEKHTFRTPDGNLHNWALELSQKIISLQDKDGSWVNGYAERWYEGNPYLVTAYAVLVLNNCREELLAQEEFLRETPNRIEALEAEKGEANAKRAREIDEEIKLLTETLEDLKATRK